MEVQEVTANFMRPRSTKSPRSIISAPLLPRITHTQSLSIHRDWPLAAETSSPINPALAPHFPTMGAVRVALLAGFLAAAGGLELTKADWDDRLSESRCDLGPCASCAAFCSRLRRRRPAKQFL